MSWGIRELNLRIKSIHNIETIEKCFFYEQSVRTGSFRFNIICSAEEFVENATKSQIHIIVTDH